MESKISVYGKSGAELAAGRDAELGEDLAEVPLDGAGGQEELGADLGVGTAFDGQPVSTWTQLNNAIHAAQPGQDVTITVRRDGQTVTLRTTLASVTGRSGPYLGVGPAVVFQIANPVRAVQYAGSTFGQTLVGSAKMLRETGTHPTVLREQVTSPGGTTAAAIRELEDHKVRAAFITAMEAARDRSVALAATDD